MDKLPGILHTVFSCLLFSGISTSAMAFTLPVPEPDTLFLLAAGVGAALIAGKLRGRK